jgi:hypothetical protein
MPKRTDMIYMSDEDLKKLQFVLNYVVETEEKSYEEHVYSLIDKSPEETYGNGDLILNKKFYNRPDIKHIYAITRQVKDAVDCSR